jgi:hypothetical protein
MLRQLARDAEADIAVEHVDLKTLAPAPGRQDKQQVAAFLAERAESQIRCARHRAFIRRCEVRAQEATDLIGHAGITPVSLGKFIDVLVLVQDILAAGQVDRAADYVRQVIDQWETYEAGTRTDDTPLRVLP